jgi:hypothetical protein
MQEDEKENNLLELIEKVAKETYEQSLRYREPIVCLSVKQQETYRRLGIIK